MKISLIIPAYNEEKYIGPCLTHAVKNSDGVFSEIIVVDNGSSDRTAEIARGFPGVRVVREENKGLTHARQRGLIEATGDILTYIDADTLMPSGWARQIPQAFLNPNIVTLSGPYIYYEQDKFQQFLVWMYWYLLGLPTYWIARYLLVGGNFAIRKDTIEKMGGFDTTIAFYGEDTNIARRASKFGTVKFKLGFAMQTSARRLEKEGMWKICFTYLKNFLSEALLHRPSTHEYEDFR